MMKCRLGIIESTWCGDTKFKIIISDNYAWLRGGKSGLALTLPPRLYKVIDWTSEYEN